MAGEVEKLKKLGVNVMTDILIGKTISIDELFDEYGFDAVFVGTGAGLPMFMKIPGEGLAGVYSANEYLTRLNLMKAYDPEYDTPIAKGNAVAIVGGGNVAMDASRWAKRLGAEHVYVVYRRGMEELPARKEEVEHAIEEEIEFKTLCNPVAVIEDEKNPVMSAQSVASRWNWANPTLLAVVPPRLSPAANSTCLLTPSSCPWAPAPTP